MHGLGLTEWKRGCRGLPMLVDAAIEAPGVRWHAEVGVTLRAAVLRDHLRSARSSREEGFK